MDIFISYSRQSKEIARTLAEGLIKLRHNVWFDPELTGGQVWWDQILNQIRKCEVFVFVLEPAALNSSACMRELDYANDLNKLILPIQITDMSMNLLPPVLARIHLEDYREPTPEASFRLAGALASLPAPKPVPDPLPQPPEVPVSYLSSLTERVKSADLKREQQTDLFFDLKQAFIHPDTTGDARALLRQLRNRRDIVSDVAQEIDKLLSKKQLLPSKFSLLKPAIIAAFIGTVLFGLFWVIKLSLNGDTAKIDFEGFQIGDTLKEVNDITSKFGVSFEACDPQTFKIKGDGSNNFVQAGTDSTKGDIVINFNTPMRWIKVEFLALPSTPHKTTIGLAAYDRNLKPAEVTDDKFSAYHIGGIYHSENGPFTPDTLKYESESQDIMAVKLEMAWDRILIDNIKFGQSLTSPAINQKVGTD